LTITTDYNISSPIGVYKSASLLFDLLYQLPNKVFGVGSMTLDVMAPKNIKMYFTLEIKNNLFYYL